MKTKREILEHIAKYGSCAGINCNTECPHAQSKHCPSAEFKKIGAMAILRMFRKKPTFDVGTEIKFSDGKIAEICELNGLYYLAFGGYRKSIEYLVGRTWEVIE